MITEGTRLWLTLFSRLCYSIDRQVSQSEASENAIQDLSSMSISGYLAVWCSSLWSSRSKMTDKSHLWYLVRLWWHLLEASVYAIDSHNTAAVAWGTFSEIFSHHFPRPQTSIDFSAARMLSFFTLIGRWRHFTLSTLSYAWWTEILPGLDHCFSRLRVSQFTSVPGQVLGGLWVSTGEAFNL